MKIVIETEVQAPLATVWDTWVTPNDITNWNFAIDDWCCPRAEVNLEVGGNFNYRMEAKDSSKGFDFEGTFTKIESNESIHFKLGDNRVVIVEFIETINGV
ncbi:SRPBCC domain-containing protein [Pseudoalteromonas sp. CO325X]|uniref:SRPBCC domain-containing protein n=1 Tax=Pseudoalteromonas sp. CO325X TaxID=1777262 RepID=UPI001F0E4B32|nr:SRPBCC domain-containing protein [Pseudoalteromonas sp. CO325X]